MNKRKLLGLCIGIIWAIAVLNVNINFAVIMGLALAMVFGLFDSKAEEEEKKIEGNHDTAGLIEDKTENL